MTEESSKAEASGVDRERSTTSSQSTTKANEQMEHKGSATNRVPWWLRLQQGWTPQPGWSAGQKLVPVSPDGDSIAHDGARFCAESINRSGEVPRTVRTGVRGFEVVDQEKSERNADIIAARARGETLNSLALKHGVTRQRIEQIVKGGRYKPRPKPIADLIAYAEKAIPNWRTSLEVWKETGIYRGKRIDAAWIHREEMALRELEMSLASWLQRQREGGEYV